MNILFMTISNFRTVEESSIYCDLLRCFRDHGHEVYTVSPYEKRTGKNTEYTHADGIHMLHIATGNITQSKNIIEKGLATVTIESRFKKGIREYLSDVRFDLILYSTPPITFYKAIRFVKERDHAKTYLLLKDIFPQNAVDLGMMSQTGIKGLLYRYFRKKEKNLYAVSDRIGCMSEANVSYVLRHNAEISPEKTEICPNCIAVSDRSIDSVSKAEIRKKYGIPLDKQVFVYGGNLGKPQCVPFIIDCLKTQEDSPDRYFLIVGNGTDYPRLDAYFQERRPANMKLLQRLPKEDFDTLVGACDVGMIFLDCRFTIPNFPSRLLSYMQAKVPVLTVTDRNTDVGTTVVNGGFGWQCESTSPEEFVKALQTIPPEIPAQMREAEFAYLQQHYSVETQYTAICASVGAQNRAKN